MKKNHRDDERGGKHDAPIDRDLSLAPAPEKNTPEDGIEEAHPELAAAPAEGNTAMDRQRQQQQQPSDAVAPRHEPGRDRRRRDAPAAPRRWRSSVGAMAAMKLAP